VADEDLKNVPDELEERLDDLSETLRTEHDDDEGTERPHVLTEDEQKS
jgi:predicted transcriptional regulator